MNTKFLEELKAENNRLSCGGDSIGKLIALFIGLAFLVSTPPGVRADVFSLNGTNAFYTGGNVGIGTNAPNGSLSIVGGPDFTQANWKRDLDLEVGGALSWENKFGLGYNGSGFFIFHTVARNVAINDFMINSAGDVAIGSGSFAPASKLEVRTGTGFRGFAQTDGTISVGSYVGGSASGATGGWLGTFTNHPLHFFVKDGQPAMTVETDGNVNIAGEVAAKAFHPRGADVAELFQINEEKLEKGTVVVIDPAHPGRLKPSTEPYDTKVAGIISGANGIDAGIVLHQEAVSEDGQNVALSGRVYVRGDNSNGPIKPGDLMTTSKYPGQAMRVKNPERARGAVIGKAMTPRDETTGMVLVLVTLQ